MNPLVFIDSVRAAMAYHWEDEVSPELELKLRVALSNQYVYLDDIQQELVIEDVRKFPMDGALTAIGAEVCGFILGVLMVG